MNSSTGGSKGGGGGSKSTAAAPAPNPPCGQDDLAGDDCNVQLIDASSAVVASATSSSYSLFLPFSNSSLLYFQLPLSVPLPIWLYTHVISSANNSGALVSLLLWTPPSAVSLSNQSTAQLRRAALELSRYTVASTAYTNATANPRSLLTQRNGGADTILVAPLAQPGYYGVLLTNTDSRAAHNYTVNLSTFSSRPVVSPASAFAFNFPVSSLGLFFLFLLLSSLCLGCLVLGRRYCASFRRKGGKKYYGVDKAPEADGRGGAANGAVGLDGRAEGGDNLEAWDAEMKEMDSLELQLSDEEDRNEFELNEIATIYRQPQQPQPQPQQQAQSPQQLQQATSDGSGKRSPASREELKTNGGRSGSPSDRVIASPTRLSSVVVEGASRRSPSPIAQPVVQPVTELQQRVQSATSSGKKKKKKRRDEGSEQSET